jgi:hypothetical protein
MNKIYGLDPVVRAVLGCLFAVLIAGPACGKSDGGPGASRSGGPGKWTKIELIGRFSFQGEVVEDKDLSGLACISDRYCLVGADEAREVQVLELLRDAHSLRVVETVSLLRSGDEIDIEGIAAEGDCYYVIGSHGISKKQGESQGNRYSIFRLKVDPATGTPAGTLIAGVRVPASLEVASLARILRADPVLGEHFGKPLQQKGINIEGLAARNGRLFVGFRNPNLNGDAFVMEISADDVFARTTQPKYTLHRLRLGEGLGIREIVAARSSFVIIAGNAGSEPSEKYVEAEDYEADRDFYLFTWDGKGPDVHKIGLLPEVRGKAEAMTILEEAADHLTVLVLFDGPKQGRPSVYRIQ